MLIPDICSDSCLITHMTISAHFNLLSSIMHWLPYHPKSKPVTLSMP